MAALVEFLLAVRDTQAYGSGVDAPLFGFNGTFLDFNRLRKSGSLGTRRSEIGAYVDAASVLLLAVECVRQRGGMTIEDSPSRRGDYMTAAFAASIKTFLIALLLVAQLSARVRPLGLHRTLLKPINVGVALAHTLAFKEWANCHANLIIFHTAKCQASQIRGKTDGNLPLSHSTT